MSEQELKAIEARVQKHTGLLYRADLESLLGARAENVRLQREVESYREAANRLASENESLAQGPTELVEAARRVLVRLNENAHDETCICFACQDRVALEIALERLSPETPSVAVAGSHIEVRPE